MPLAQVDWPGIFMPTVPLPEMALRGTVRHFVLLSLTRRRTVSSIGIILATPLIAWSYALNWLAYAVPAIDWLVSPRALPVVRDGRLLRRDMRAELLIEEELMRLLRMKGVEELGEIRMATVEGDGTLSVIKRETGDGQPA